MAKTTSLTSFSRSYEYHSRFPHKSTTRQQEGVKSEKAAPFSQCRQRSEQHSAPGPGSWCLMSTPCSRNQRKRGRLVSHSPAQYTNYLQKINHISWSILFLFPWSCFALFLISDFILQTKDTLKLLVGWNLKVVKICGLSEFYSLLKSKTLVYPHCIDQDKCLRFSFYFYY